MAKGIFVSFEGGDGAGKSTQALLLTEYIKAGGTDCVYTREPGGTPISEAIRDLLLDSSHGDMSEVTEALLYAASRAQLVTEVIAPALREGKTVVCDRFMDSSIAYQGYARSLGDEVRLINEFAIQGLAPDITFFLDLPPEKAIKRIDRERSRDRLESEEMEFHRTVYKGYLELSEIYKDRYIRIDASRSIDEIARDVRESFDEYVARRSEAQR